MSDISLSFGSSNRVNMIVKSVNSQIGEELSEIITYTPTSTTTPTIPTIPFVDTLPPVITISGLSPFYHEVLTPYIDPGATAYDACFGNVSVNVVNDVCSNVVGTYQVIYTASDSCNNDASAVRIVNVLDNIAPVITINGSISLNHEVFTSYIDQGATVTDNYDSSVPFDVSGTVDISNLGVYHIYYNATDSYGNQAIPQTRTVTVIDTTLPIININGSSSLNLEVFTPYIDQGATAIDQYFGDLSVNVINDVCSNIIGTYTVTYTAHDLCGNQAIPKIRTVYVIDTVSPIITISGPNPLDLKMGYQYVEYGATANDQYFGVISPVDICSNVNTSIAGSYQVIYSASDQCNNDASSVRIVNVLPVDFTFPVILINWQNLGFNVNLDFSGTTRNPLFSDVDNLLNDIDYNYPGINDAGPTGSVKTYYDAISHGNMNVQFDILNASTTHPIPNNQLTDLNAYAYEISNNYQDNGDANDWPPNLLRSQLSDAYDQAIFNIGSNNFNAKYVNNSGIIFIQAGFGAENGSGYANYIWSHKSTFSYSGNNINYNINPFKNPTLSTPKIGTIGVIAHESLHSFGLPDLYDTDYSSRGAGRSSIMASGSWGYLLPNNTPWLPSFANTWTRNELSSYFTTNIITISGDQSNLKLPSISLENKSYQINHPDSSITDYWLIEYRTATGFNRNLHNGINGLAIWHINPTRTNNNNEIPINNRGESGYMVGLEQYDGLFNLESNGLSQDGDIWPNNTIKEFSPYTCPSTVSSSGIPSGIKIHNIALVGNDVQFDVSFLLLNPPKQIIDVSHSGFNASYLGSNGNITVNATETIYITTTQMNNMQLELTLNNNQSSLDTIPINNNTSTGTGNQYIDSLNISNMIHLYGRLGFNILSIYDHTKEAFIWNYHFTIHPST